MSDDSTGSPTHRYPSNGVQGHYSGRTPRQMNSGPEYQLGGTTLENGHITNGIALGGNNDTPKERGGLCGGGRTSKELPQRYVLVFMTFLAFVNIYMMYLNLSVALPAMVDHNATKLKTLDDQKGVFFENSELESEAYEQINKNFSTKREKRQRNISQDDLFYLNSDNNIDSTSHSIKKNNKLNHSDSFISPLVNNISTVTLLPISEITMAVEVMKNVSTIIYNGMQNNKTSNLTNEQSNLKLEPLNDKNGSNATEFSYDDVVVKNSVVQRHSADDVPPKLPLNDNSTLKLVENKPNLTLTESTTQKDSYIITTIENTVIDTLSSALPVDTNKSDSVNTSVGSEASITFNFVTKPTEGNVSLLNTESEYNLDAKTNHNINLSIDDKSNIKITFNNSNLKVDHIKYELEPVHTANEVLNYSIEISNNPVKRTKRDLNKLTPLIIDVNHTSLPKFHVAEIVPVTKGAVTEKPKVQTVIWMNVTSPHPFNNLTESEILITTLENSTSSTVVTNSKDILNKALNVNLLTLTTTDQPVTNTLNIDRVTIPIASSTLFNAEGSHSETNHLKLSHSNESSIIIDKTSDVTRSHAESTTLSIQEEKLSETTIATMTETYDQLSSESMSSTTGIKISVENAADHSLNKTLLPDSTKSMFSENFLKENFDDSNLSETVTPDTPKAPETFPINQTGEPFLKSSLNETLSEEDSTFVYLSSDEFGIISSTETSVDHSLLSKIEGNHNTTNIPTTDTSINNLSTSIIQRTKESNYASKNSTQNTLNEVLITNVTSIVEKFNNTILTSNFKENLIKETTVPSNEEVKSSENFVDEKLTVLGEYDNSTPPIPNLKHSLPTNNTSEINASLPFVTPLSIPCQTFLFVNCSITGTYHVIDKKGMETTNSNESDWVTLQPIPQLSDNYKYQLNGDEGDDNDSNERQKLLKKYNFSEHFNLVDCHVSHGDDEENSDIKCITSHGPIKLSIIDENDTSASSSSSSSSSSQENDEEEEESEEGDEEEGEEDEEEEGEDENEKKGKKKEGEEKVGGFVDFGRWVPPGNYKKITLRDEKENKDQENDEENEQENMENEEKGMLKDDEKANEEDKASPKLKDGNLKNKECEESSEECEEDEEEEDEDEEDEKEGDGEEEEKEGDGEEEHDENELTEEFAGPASGQIKLEGKIPSTVCFYKKFAETDSFHGYEDGEFNWEPDLQTKIISAYYWGFLLSQIPAGRLSAIVGGKLLLLFGVLMAGIITLFTPLLASAGAYWLLTARVILGMMQGICMPATQSLLAKWAPPMERTRMVAYTYSGIAVGAAMGGPLSAYLIQEIGWRTLCYGQGAIALIWSALWFLLIAESPCTHPRITNREREYVTGAIGYQHAGVGIAVPWCSILRSRHVLALMLAQGSYLWAWHTLLHYAPKYIATVLHDELPVVQSVWGASLACMFVVTCAYGTLADWLRKSRKLSTISVRRAANSICSILSAGFLVGVSQSYCNRVAVKVCFALAIAMGFPGAFSGIFANSLDLAPNHAAAITGICGAFATTASILAPYYWSLIVSGRQTLERWRTIWYTCAIFLLLANCLYFLLVGTKEQRWNRPVTLNKTPKRDEEHEVVIPRRRANQTHGMKPKLYASTEHL